MAEKDRPGQGFEELEASISEAGLISSDLVVMMPEDVLGVIGNMGPARARILRNYAKRVVLPILGLRGNFEEPEIVYDDLNPMETAANQEEQGGHEVEGSSEVNNLETDGEEGLSGDDSDYECV
jgi:hypothetical protein